MRGAASAIDGPCSEEPVGGDEAARRRRLRRGCEGGIDSPGLAAFSPQDAPADGGGAASGILVIWTRLSEGVRIQQHGDPIGLGHQVVQLAQSFRDDIVLVKIDPRRVAARPIASFATSTVLTGSTPTTKTIGVVRRSPLSPPAP